ncbi:formate transporter FocA [Pseudovibrio flavus]|uniref:formate transporter FocA n=1 Tax=Pseudovibrio flavus TaxID=2529854 RepID=UPI00211BE989|nr:formate transporter FocA [Pseudovibrio flavus]
MAAEPTTYEKQYLTPPEMMAQAAKYALYKCKKSSTMTLSLAVMGGAFIGLAFIFYITTTTGSSQIGWGVSRVLGGFMFSMGLMLVVLCGAELFTSTVLTAIAWANRQVSVSKMLQGWGKVYLGNLVGALALVALVYAGGVHMLHNGEWGLNAMKIAQHKLHHTPLQAFSLGVLCNLMVCLATWMTFSSTNAMTKAFMVMMPVAMFVSTGFEHSVANMFMVPLGITIQSLAGPEFWSAVGADPAQFADLTIGNFIFANLIPVTLGNIVGGAGLVGLANWWIYENASKKTEEKTSEPAHAAKSDCR